MRHLVSGSILLLWLVLPMVETGCTPAPIYTSMRNATSKSKAGSKATAAFRDTGMAGQIAVSGDLQNALRREIDTWMGTPYAFGVVEKGKGTDCSGFVGAVFRQVLGKDLPRQASDMYSLGEPVEVDELRFGDLVFFQNTYKGARGASHVGIYLGEGSFAHASTTVGVTLSLLKEAYYQKHFLGCRRMP